MSVLQLMMLLQLLLVLTLALQHGVWAGNQAAFNCCVQPEGCYCPNGLTSAVTLGSKTDASVRGSLEDGSGPEAYAACQDCFWIINAPPGFGVDFETRVLDLRLFDNVTIHDGKATSDPVLIDLNAETDGLPKFASQSDTVLVHFFSTPVDASDGFMLQYSYSRRNLPFLFWAAIGIASLAFSGGVFLFVRSRQLKASAAVHRRHGDEHSKGHRAKHNGSQRRGGEVVLVDDSPAKPGFVTVGTPKGGRSPSASPRTSVDLARPGKAAFVGKAAAAGKQKRSLGRAAGADVVAAVGAGGAAAKPKLPVEAKKGAKPQATEGKAKAVDAAAAQKRDASKAKGGDGSAGKRDASKAKGGAGSAGKRDAPKVKGGDGSAGKRDASKAKGGDGSAGKRDASKRHAVVAPTAEKREASGAAAAAADAKGKTDRSAEEARLVADREAQEFRERGGGDLDKDKVIGDFKYGEAAKGGKGRKRVGDKASGGTRGSRSGGKRKKSKGKEKEMDSAGHEAARKRRHHKHHQKNQTLDSDEERPEMKMTSMVAHGDHRKILQPVDASEESSLYLDAEKPEVKAVTFMTPNTEAKLLAQHEEHLLARPGVPDRHKSKKKSSSRKKSKPRGESGRVIEFGVADSSDDDDDDDDDGDGVY